MFAQVHTTTQTHRYTSAHGLTQAWVNTGAHAHTHTRTHVYAHTRAFTQGRACNTHKPASARTHTAASHTRGSSRDAKLPGHAQSAQDSTAPPSGQAFSHTADPQTSTHSPAISPTAVCKTHSLITGALRGQIQPWHRWQDARRFQRCLCPQACHLLPRPIPHPVSPQGCFRAAVPRAP